MHQNNKGRVLTWTRPLALPKKVCTRVLERTVHPLAEHQIQDKQYIFLLCRGLLDQIFILLRIFFLCSVSCSAALQDYRLSGLLLKGYVVHVQLQRMLFLVPLKVILAAVQVRWSKINLNKTVTDGFLLTLYFTHGGNFQQICKLLTFQFFLLIVDVQHRAGSSLIYHHLLIRPLMDTDIKKTHVSIMILLWFYLFFLV